MIRLFSTNKITSRTQESYVWQRVGVSNFKLGWLGWKIVTNPGIAGHGSCPFLMCHLWANFTATIRQRLGIAPNGGDLVSPPNFNEKWCLGVDPFFWEGNFSGASPKCPTNSGLVIIVQFAQMNVLMLVRMVRFQLTGITINLTHLRGIKQAANYYGTFYGISTRKIPHCLGWHYFHGPWLRDKLSQECEVWTFCRFEQWKKALVV